MGNHGYVLSGNLKGLAVGISWDQISRVKICASFVAWFSLVNVAMRKIKPVVGFIVAFIAVSVAEILACGIDIINPSNFDGLISFHIENRPWVTAKWLSLRAVAAVPVSNIAAIS
jgi:hypothetical protein